MSITAYGDGVRKQTPPVGICVSDPVYPGYERRSSSGRDPEYEY
jgi:hypothetical protein